MTMLFFFFFKDLIVKQKIVMRESTLLCCRGCDDLRIQTEWIGWLDTQVINMKSVLWLQRKL